MAEPWHRCLCVLILAGIVAQDASASMAECRCKAEWHGNHSNLPRDLANKCLNQQGCPTVACDYGLAQSWCEVVDKDCSPPLGFYTACRALLDNNEDKHCMFCDESSIIGPAPVSTASQSSADEDESSIDPLLVQQIICVVLLSCTACVCCGAFVTAYNRSRNRDLSSLEEAAKHGSYAICGSGCCILVGMILLGAWLSQTEYRQTWSNDCPDADCVASPMALFASSAALYVPAGVAVYFVVFTLATGPADTRDDKDPECYSFEAKAAACLWALKMFFIDTFDTLLSLLLCIWMRRNEVEVGIQVIAGISCALGFIQWLVTMGVVIKSATGKYIDTWAIPGCLGLFADIFSLAALFVLETVSPKGDSLPVIMKLLDFVLSALGLGGDFVQIIAPIVSKRQNS